MHLETYREIFRQSLQANERFIPFVKIQKVIIDIIQTWNSLSLRETEHVTHVIIVDNFGGDLVIIAKNHEQLQKSFKNYSIENTLIERQYYTFLKNIPTDEGLKKLAERDFGEDKYEIIDDMVYIAFATKASNSKLTNNVIEQKLGTSATTRNYNTTKRLAELTT